MSSTKKSPSLDQQNQNPKYPPLTTEFLSTGCFMLYKNMGGFFGDMIEKHQIRMGIAPERARYVHIDVLGPRQWAIRVNPPRSEVVDVFKRYRGVSACMVRYKAPDYDIGRRYVAWWAVSHNNLRYDYLGVLKFKLGWLFHRKNLYFCSENAAWALRQEYPTAFKGLQTHTIMPGHFLGPQFEVIWRGIIL